MANLLERAVENRRLTTFRMALLQQEQVVQEEIVLQERQGSTFLQEEHNLELDCSPDILSPLEMMFIGFAKNANSISFGF